MSVDYLLSVFVQYGYGIVFVAILLDNAGLPIPGELLLLLVGALARNGELSFAGGLAVATLAALGGDSVGYWMGRLTGDRVLRAYCRLTLGSAACVSRAVAYYHAYGNAAAIVGRFAVGVRAFLPPLAGSARMPYARFVMFDGLGALLWSTAFLLAGYSFGWRLEGAAEGYRAGARVVLGTLALVLGVYILVKLVRRRRRGVGILRERVLARVAATFRAREHHATPVESLAVSIPSYHAREREDGTGRRPRASGQAAAPRPETKETAMKTRAILLFATFLLLSGVAASAHAEPATPTGTWQGVITGREMATSGGGTAQNARLVIREDGTWVLTTATWQASGTVVTRGDRLVLDGRFVTANPGKPLGPAVYYLSPLGNQGLGGSGTADYLGVHVTTGVQLKKVQ